VNNIQERLHSKVYYQEDNNIRKKRGTKLVRGLSLKSKMNGHLKLSKLRGSDWRIVVG